MRRIVQATSTLTIEQAHDPFNHAAGTTLPPVSHLHSILPIGKSLSFLKALVEEAVQLLLLHVFS